MSSPSSIVSDQLECAICTDQLWEPKLLNCGHTFCLICLEELFNPDEYPMNPEVACPMCRKKTPVPSKGISGLNTNFALQSLLEALSPLKPVTSSSDVTLKKDGEATVCEVHKEVRKFYCCTCETLICRDCTVVDHPRPEHKCMNLDEAYNWRRQLNERQLQLAVRVVRLAKKSASILETAKASVNRRCDQVIGEIERCREEGLEALQAKLEVIKDFQTDLDAEITILHDLTEDASKVEVLDQSESLVEDMTSVWSRQSVVLANPEPVQCPQFLGTGEEVQGWPHLINLDGSRQAKQHKPRPEKPERSTSTSSEEQEAQEALQDADSLSGGFQKLGPEGICDQEGERSAGTQSQQGHYRGGQWGGVQWGGGVRWAGGQKGGGQWGGGERGGSQKGGVQQGGVRREGGQWGGGQRGWSQKGGGQQGGGERGGSQKGGVQQRGGQRGGGQRGGGQQGGGQQGGGQQGGGQRGGRGSAHGGYHRGRGQSSRGRGGTSNQK